MSIFSVNSASFENISVTDYLEVTGSIFVNGYPIPSNISKYGTLAFNKGVSGEYSYYTPMEVNPPFASFRFPTEPRDWSQSVNRITMDFFNGTWITSDPDFDGGIRQRYPYDRTDSIQYWHNYTNKLLDIINKGLTDTILTLKSVDFPNTFKQFKIKGGTFYGNYNSGSNRAIKLNWGDNILDFSSFDPVNNWNNIPSNNKVNDPSMFYLSEYGVENENMWPDYYNYRSTNDSITQPLAYFDLSVEEVSSGHEWYEEKLFSNQLTPVLSTVQPENCTFGTDESENDLFWIDFQDAAPNKRRKVIQFVTQSRNITIPSWTEKITTICIGAGGGGGGGASGFKHSDSIPFFEDSDANKQDVTGYPGNRVPASNKPFGHEFVTGGGGGAGGCVAIETLTGQIVKDNRGNSLSVTVGSPGKGGIGSSYLNDVVAASPRGGSSLDEINRWKILLSTDYIFKIDLSSFGLVTLLPKSADVTSNNFVATPFSMLQSGITTMSPSGNEYNGKPGGDTFVSLTNNIFVLAKGGNGGTAGLAIRDSATPFHLMCRSIDHSPSLAMVPGGANKLSDCIGSDIRIGGPGGYGVTMPSPQQKWINKITPDTIDFIYFSEFARDLWEETIFANEAIDVPWKVNDNFNPNSHANNVFPIGNTVRGNLSTSDMYLKYSSNGYDIPTKPAPTGGGGGCGVSFSGVDQKSASVYPQSVYTQRLGYLKDGAEVPDDFFQRTANLITEYVGLGLGGTNTVTEYLINEADETGKIFSLELNSTGSHGGYGKYGIAADNDLSPNGIPYEDLQPQPGQDFGYGGGGGAGRYVLNHNDKFRTDDETLYPTKGQDGADGGRGLAIIIFE